MALKGVCRIILYADDIVLLIIGKTLEELVKNQALAMKILEEYLNNNHLVMNHLKTNYMLFNRSANTKKLFESVTNIKLVSNCKYLGMIIDDKLSWQLHIIDLNKKLAKANFAMKQLRKVCNLETLKKVYYGYVYSFHYNLWSSFVGFICPC
jgi:hypothetical protein